MSERIKKVKASLAESRKYLDAVLDRVGSRWDMQVYADGLQWTVRQLLNHLADAEIGHYRQATSIAEGSDIIPEDFDIERYNRRVTEKTADKTPQQARQELAESRQKLNEWLDQLDESKLDNKGRHASLIVMTVEQILGVLADHEYTHGKDIARVLSIQIPAEAQAMKTTVEKKLAELKSRLMEINDLNAAASLLAWDQSTYMPPGGAPYRGRHMATLGRLAHEKATDPLLGRLVDSLVDYGKSLPYDSDDAALIRVAHRDFHRRNRVPAWLLTRIIEHASHTYQVWTEARPANNFHATADLLETTLELSREYAALFPHVHLADPLIDEADYGMKASDIREVFSSLRAELVPLVKAITTQDAADDTCLKQEFPQDAQLAFALKIAEQFGYDLERGRQDLTHHPFAAGISPGDVRITTRVKLNDLTEALFSTLHEAGHAMYEQGIDPALDGTPLHTGTTAGVHESQSRLWENVVGRSRGFWEHYYPQLQAVFLSQLGGVSLDNFYRAINKVQRSLIRTDADEVTYNLHVMLRFDLELDLLDDKLKVRDLPEAWNARYRADLGIVAPDDVDGVLQDVHWYGGLIGGAFQGYTLGNIMSLQFYEAALKAHPEIPVEIGQGKFSTLHTWLRSNIYRHGRKFTATELLQRVTGGALDAGPYLRYLRTKYGELYTL